MLLDVKVSGSSLAHAKNAANPEIRDGASRFGVEEAKVSRRSEPRFRVDEIMARDTLPISRPNFSGRIISARELRQ